jgi:putative DNA primase/helicase
MPSVNQTLPSTQAPSNGAAHLNSHTDPGKALAALSLRYPKEIQLAVAGDHVAQQCRPLPGETSSPVYDLIIRSVGIGGDSYERHLQNCTTPNEFAPEQSLWAADALSIIDELRSLAPELDTEEAKVLARKLGSAIKRDAAARRKKARAAQAITATTPATIDEKPPPAERELVLACLESEEAGDAELFSHIYNNGRVLFDHSAGQWYIWAGHYYTADATGIMRRLVPGQLAAQYLFHASVITREAETEGCDSKRGLADKLIKRAKQLRRLNRIKSILEMAQSWLGITGSEWDARPELLAVKNGVVELSTGTLRAGHPNDRLRTVAPVEWQGLDASAQRWEQFICEIFGGDSELANFTRRLLGCGVYGRVIEHKLPIFYGAGRNGKDTLLETIAAVLGKCAGAVSQDILISTQKARGGSATPHLCDLQGKRLAWVAEPDEGVRLSVGQAKYLTGGGSITARPLYGKQFEFDPSHLLLLITNHRPHAPADDEALWERLLLIPFTQKFIANPSAENEHPVDLHLKARLRSEAPGVLAWLVRGYMEWKRDGLNPPATVREATEKYQREEDTLADFLQECCIEKIGAEVRASNFYSAYKSWAESNSLKAMGSKTFGQKMTKRFAKNPQTTGIFYYGVGLLCEPCEPCEPSYAQKSTVASYARKSYDEQGSQGSQGSQADIGYGND